MPDSSSSTLNLGISPLLIVEDSDEDYFTFLRIMQECEFQRPVLRACDGEDALDYLYHRGQYLEPQRAPRPAVIVMDLNLPGTDGREVIEQVKQDQSLKSIPIVVLTTSSNPRDVDSCYHFGINSYMLKPIGVPELRHTIKNFLHYWFEAIVLPTDDPYP
ncbi:MAG: response regulator [Leptolyngbyaceae cyanobacterium bins.349]|nr:response regulator [Leptolyngbyaceae cyanobacterium bins.349]